MKHRDFRHLDESAQAEVRRIAFRKIDDGWPIDKVADLAEVHFITVYEWIKRRDEFEQKDWRRRIRGRRPKEQRILTVDQEENIKEKIVEKIPKDFHLGSALWDRKAIKKLKWGIYQSPPLFFL